MQDIFAYINLYQGAIGALATIVIAFAALMTGLLTRSLVYENRLLRKAGTEPEVVAYLITDRRYTTMVNFVLANIGQGAAKSVGFSIDADAADFSTHKVALRKLHYPKIASVLPQGEQIVAFFGAGHELFQEPRLQPFKVNVAYEDIRGGKRADTFVLDVSQFDGLVRLGSPADHEAAEALKKIEGHLSWFASGMKRLKVEMITTQEARKEDEELRERYEKKLLGAEPSDTGP